MAELNRCDFVRGGYDFDIMVDRPFDIGCDFRTVFNRRSKEAR